MPYRSKVFYLVLALGLLILPWAAQAHEEDEKTRLYNTPKSATENTPKGGMQSRHWKVKQPTKPENPKQPEKPDVNAKTDAEEKTQDQKIWEKYRELAAGKGHKTKEDKETETTDEETDKEETDKEEETTKEKPSVKDAEKAHAEKQSPGLTGIIEAYKASQKGKGKMSSRSYGDID